MVRAAETDAAVASSLPLSGDDFPSKPTSYFSSEANVCHFYTRRAAAVEAVAFTPDGYWLAVGRVDGQIDIYDFAAERIVLSLPGGESRSARCLRFVTKTCPNPEEDRTGPFSLLRYRLISAGLHGVITEWNLASGSIVCEVPSFGGAVFAIDVDEELGLLVTASDDGGARLFYLRSDAAQRVQNKRSSTTSSEENLTFVEDVLIFWKALIKHDGRLLSICLYNGTRVFAGTANSLIVGWTLHSGVCDAKMELDTADPPKNSSDLEVGDMRLKASPQSPKERGLATLPKPQETLVWTLLALPDFQCVVSGDSAGAVYFWDIHTLTPVRSFKPHQLDVLSLALHPEKRDALFSAGLDGRVCFFVSLPSTSSTLQAPSPQGHWIYSGSRQAFTSDARAVAVSPGGHIAVGSVDAQVAVLFDGPDNLVTQQRTLLPGHSAAQSARWLHVAQQAPLILGIQQNAVDIWSFKPPPLSRENGTTETIRHSVSLPTPTKLLRLELGDAADDVNGWQAIRCSALSSDGSWIIFSNDYGTRLYRFNTSELSLEPVRIKKLCRRICTAVTFGLCNSKLCLIAASIGARRSEHTSEKIRLTLWDMNEQTLLTEFSGFTAAIQDMATSQDGQWLAVRSVLGRVSIFSLNTFQRVVDLPYFPPPTAVPTTSTGMEDAGSSPGLRMVGGFAFSPDSRYLVVLSARPKHFMIYSVVDRRFLTSYEVAPRQSLLTDDDGVFRLYAYEGVLLFHALQILPLRGSRGDDVGTVAWVSGEESRWTDKEHKRIAMQTLLIQTRLSLVSIRFQIFPNLAPKNRAAPSLHEDDDHPMNTTTLGSDLSLTPLQSRSDGRKRHRDSLDNGETTAVPSSTLRLSCRSRKMKNTSAKIFRFCPGTECLSATIVFHESSEVLGASGPDMTTPMRTRVDQEKPSLLLFVQPIATPSTSLVSTAVRKRYAT